MGIHPSQMRVVGVEEGSTIFTMTLETENDTPGSDDNKETLLGYVTLLKQALEEDTLGLEWEIESCEITEAFNEADDNEETQNTYELAEVILTDEGEVDVQNTIILCVIIICIIAFVIIALFITRRIIRKRKERKLGTQAR